MVCHHVHATWSEIISDEAREVDKLCEVCVEFFRQNALFVADARANRWSSPTAAMALTCAHRSTSVDAPPMSRRLAENGLAEKFFVQQGFLRCNGSLGAAKTAVILTASRPRTQGNDTWSVFQVCCDFLPGALRT